MWLKSYAVKIDIPASHILNAKNFTKGERKYVLQLVKFVVPSELRTKMIVKPSNPFYDDLDVGNIMLRVMERDQKSAKLTLVPNGYVILENAMEPITCFSQDCSLLAYLVKEPKQ